MPTMEDASKKRLRTKTPPAPLEEKVSAKSREKKDKKDKKAPKKDAKETSKKRLCEKPVGEAEQQAKRSKTPKPSNEADSKKAKQAEKKAKTSSSKPKQEAPESRPAARNAAEKDAWVRKRSVSGLESPTSSQQRGMAELMDIKKAAMAKGMTVDAFLNKQSGKELTKQMRRLQQPAKAAPLPSEARHVEA